MDVKWLIILNEMLWSGGKNIHKQPTLFQRVWLHHVSNLIIYHTVRHKLIIMISYLVLSAIYFWGSILASADWFTLVAELTQFRFQCNQNYVMCAHKMMTWYWIIGGPLLSDSPQKKIFFTIEWSACNILQDYSWGYNIFYLCKVFLAGTAILTKDETTSLKKQIIYTKLKFPIMAFYKIM